MRLRLGTLSITLRLIILLRARINGLPDLKFSHGTHYGVLYMDHCRIVRGKLFSLLHTLQCRPYRFYHFRTYIKGLILRAHNHHFELDAETSQMAVFNRRNESLFHFILAVSCDRNPRFPN